MADELKKWDVAISFASADEPLALQLRDLLQPHSVFVFSKAQEHLAGKDGVEAFRTVFRDQCALAVVLYTEPWGATAWTRVEKIAIEERCLESGWEHLIFVRFKAGEVVPKWIPKPHLYLDFTTFGLPDLVGAIKLRLAELGVESQPLSPATRAAAQERRRAFDAETESLLSLPPWPFDDVANELFNAIRVQAAQIEKETGWNVQCGPAAIIGGFAITAQGQTVQLRSGRRAVNSTDDVYLIVSEFDQSIPIQEAGKIYHVFKAINSVQTRRMWIRRLPEVGWCWELDDRVLPIEAAAVAVVHILLDRIEWRQEHPKKDREL